MIAGKADVVRHRLGFILIAIAALIRLRTRIKLSRLRRSGFKFPGMSKIDQWSPVDCRMMVVGIVPARRALRSARLSAGNANTASQT